MEPLLFRSGILEVDIDLKREFGLSIKSRGPSTQLHATCTLMQLQSQTKEDPKPLSMLPFSSSALFLRLQKEAKTKRFACISAPKRETCGKRYAYN